MEIESHRNDLEPQVVKSVRKIFLILIRRSSLCMPWIPLSPISKRLKISMVLKHQKVFHIRWRIRYSSDWRLAETRPLMRYIQLLHRCDPLFLCGIMESSVFLAAYVILGINAEVKDILIICADGLTGIKEAISAAFPKTEYQRCIVHQVRNTLKYVRTRTESLLQI